MAENKLSKALKRVLNVVVLVPVTLLVLAALIALSPFLLIYGAVWWLRGEWLVRRFRKEYGRHGKYAILVYSESPNWQQYFEERVLPQAGDRAVIINWSERRLWRRSPNLPVRVFLYFKPGREYNPYALVFEPGGKPHAVEFFSAFRDYKHGKERRLNRAVEELLDSLLKAERAWAKETESARSAA